MLTPDNVLVSGKLANDAVISVHVASIPWHGSGPMIQIFGREGTLVYHGSHIDYTRLEGARSADSSLQELPVPERLVWVPEGVPKGPPFNVAQMPGRVLPAGSRPSPRDPPPVPGPGHRSERLPALLEYP